MSQEKLQFTVFLFYNYEMKLYDKRYYCYNNSWDTKRMQDMGKQDLLMYKRDNYALWTLFRQKKKWESKEKNSFN